MSETISTENLSVAVITVSYGSGMVLKEFLSSLRKHHLENIEVVVVDNKPEDEGVADIAETFAAVYVPLPHNPGYGAGMNAGVNALCSRVELARYDAFFFCNPDVRFIEPAITQLLASLINDPTAGSIGPKLLNEDGTIYPSARNIPSIGTGVGHALFSKIWPRNPWTRAYQNASEYDQRRTAGSLSGAAVMVKSGVYDLLGGWDEEYFMHFEDIDLGWRIGKAGLSNIYDPTVAVEHSGAHSTKKHAAMVEDAMTNSAIRFMNKRYAGVANAPLRWLITLGLRMRGGVRVRAVSRG